jgi:predicted nuclease of predicted toxin-antitoxin system
VKTQTLIHMDDKVIWDFAKTGDYVIASKDWDFHQLSLLRGFPPKVLCIDTGNCSTQEIINLLRDKHSDIQTFHDNPLESLLILDKS